MAIAWTSTRDALAAVSLPSPSPFDDARDALVAQINASGAAYDAAVAADAANIASYNAAVTVWYASLVQAQAETDQAFRYSQQSHGAAMTITLFGRTARPFADAAIPPADPSYIARMQNRAAQMFTGTAAGDAFNAAWTKVQQLLAAPPAVPVVSSSLEAGLTALLAKATDFVAMVAWV
jgi:hypothetical protein